MLLTRATDNRLKAFFTSGEIRYGHTPFQGKGLPIAGTGSDLRGGDPPAPRRVLPGSGRLDRRRRRPGDSRSRRRARHAAGAGGGAHGAERPDGQGRRAVRRQGSAHRRFRVGHPAAGRAAHDRRADRGRHRHGVLARWLRARRGVVHRRRRIVARRVARSDQPVRRAAPAGRLLHREQSDRAVDARDRADRRPRLRRQGDRLRDPRHHRRRHRSRCDRRGVRLGRRTGARAGWVRR